MRVDEAGGTGKVGPRSDAPRPGGGYKGASGGGYKGTGGYRGGADRDSRPSGDSPQSGAGNRGNDRGGFQKKEGFYEPKPKFPKKERKS